MPNIAQGVSKILAYKKQTGLGSPASGSGGQDLRRTSSTINLTKEAYQSAEIRSDQQIADYRHGPKQVSGTVSGELSAGTYKDFLGSVLRKDFASVTSMFSALFCKFVPCVQSCNIRISIYANIIIVVFLTWIFI